MISFKNLKNHTNTTAGIGEHILIAPVSYFTEGGIKSPGDWVTSGDSVIIKDDHDFKNGLGFITAFLAPEKNKLDAKSIGDTGFKQLNLELQVFIPGSYAQLHEWVAGLLNTPVIALTRDSNCAANLWYQLGDNCIYAYMSLDFTTETTKGNIKGYTVTISCTRKAIHLYEGDIVKIDDEEESGGVAGGLLTEDFNFLLTTEDGNVLIEE